AVATGSTAVATGDLVYRLTAEAREVGEVVFAVLKAAVPAVCQVAVMLTRMVQLSPVMTLATLCVVPLMSVIIASLGERVRRVSSEAQASIAALSARITEVLPAMLLVKAHAAEPYEALLFRHLAEADRSARLRKKRLKALFPEAITAAYAAAVVVLFGVATWAVGQGGLTGAGIVSFFTSLVLLIEPIQKRRLLFPEAITAACAAAVVVLFGVAVGQGGLTGAGIETSQNWIVSFFTSLVLLIEPIQALFPEVITAAYAAAVVVLFGVAAWAVGQGGLMGAGIVSFFTTLVLLIEPIQVKRRESEPVLGVSVLRRLKTSQWLNFLGSKCGAGYREEVTKSGRAQF
ncbi:unnamed protein product, partial [Closterium sp. NIES-54]